MTTNLRTMSGTAARRPDAGGWSRLLLPLLAVSGAVTVIAGSYSTWATFYAGLIARNGVSGHGKYFIGLAVAGAAAVLLSHARGVWTGLRWAAVAAGMVIAAVAVRDLRNLEALVGDPAAGFYLPGRGEGLFIVTAGALALGLAPLARPMRASGPPRLIPTLAAAGAVAAMALLIPGLYGEYYLHVARGHTHGHTDALQPAHLLAAGGALLGAFSGHLLLLGWLARRGSRGRRLDPRGVAGIESA